MKQAAVQVNVRERLPDTQAVSDGVRDEPENQRNVMIRNRGPVNDTYGCLGEKYAGADQDQQFDAGGDETTPIEIDPPVAVRSHTPSLRRALGLVKECGWKRYRTKEQWRGFERPLREEISFLLHASHGPRSIQFLARKVEQGRRQR